MTGTIFLNIYNLKAFKNKWVQFNIEFLNRYLMKKKNRLFKSKEKMNREEAANYLHLFADKIAEGSVQLIQGNQEVSLNLPGELIFEVEAQNKEKGAGSVKNKIELEIEWYEGESSESGGKLEIG